MTVVAETNAYKSVEDDQPVLLTSDLNCWKQSAHLLDSRLKEKHLLALGTTFYRYRDREIELRQFLTFQKKSSVVYINIIGVIKSMSLEYDATEWKTFIDSSSLKAVLRNGNSFSSVPIRHSV